MSYDFWVERPGKNPDDEPWANEPVFNDTHPALGSDGVAGNVMVTDAGYSRCGNYTSNVSKMWRRCLTAVSEGDTTLADLEGKECSEIAPLLAAAVEWGIEHLDELREMNPPNGWGNAEGAVTYLWDIQRSCEAEPNGTLRICR